MLRDYQQTAHDIAANWLRSFIEPAVIEAATGAGKSHIIAAIAETIHNISGGKHVLCLAPNAELVEQNREKFLATGNPASVFSASAGSKCLRHPVVFGTPGTVKNSIARFGSRIALIIVDECHGLTPTIKDIIKAIRSLNQNVRILGLTATPYRLNEGYIYQIDERGKPVQSRDPFFTKLLARITAHELIGRGYLTQPLVGEIGGEHYDTSGLHLNSRGQYDSADIDKAYHGHGRKTSAIIADIVSRARDRKGVMIFAATVQHANECMASLPPELSAIVTAETKKAERRRIVKMFKHGRIKYLVNVAVFTTGFDAPHVDVIALLRLTESAALLQQMIGRGLRTADGKANCLILDYAENIERHCPDGDIFNPEIKVNLKDHENGSIEVVCPFCDTPNDFSARPNPDRFEVSSDGYFLDLDGNKIVTDFGDMPAHFGRRCRAMLPAGRGALEQCSYRWTFKECPQCNHENDIAARYCISCKAEIVDPNEKLRIEFKQLKKDPTRMQCDRVVEINAINTLSQAGNEVVRIDFITEYRRFSVWFKHNDRRLELFKQAQYGDGIRTVTYKKDPDSAFYSVHAYNQQPDEGPAS